MIYINIANFILISLLEKNHSMIETLRLKNFVIFFSKQLDIYHRNFRLKVASPVPK